MKLPFGIFTEDMLQQFMGETDDFDDPDVAIVTLFFALMVNE